MSNDHNDASESLGKLSGERVHRNVNGYPAQYAEHYKERLRQRNASKEKSIWVLLDQVCDPEIPVLSLWDLGVISNIHQQENSIVVTLSPTYSGCPAMDVMREDIQIALEAAGYANIQFKTQLSPAWSSTWISPGGRDKLQKYGIAPPSLTACTESCGQHQQTPLIACPRCRSKQTQQISEFGSTACKSLHQCLSCLEPFDYFKAI